MRLGPAFLAVISAVLVAGQGCKSQGLTKCKGVCYDTQNDDKHCGDCTNECMDIVEECKKGVCVEKDRGCINGPIRVGGKCYRVYCSTAFNENNTYFISEQPGNNVHDCAADCSATANCVFASFSAPFNNCELFNGFAYPGHRHEQNFDVAKLVPCG